MAKVLVVEDDPAIRSVVGNLLEAEGYDVTLACDGAAALDHVRLAPPDCVLLDLHMPRMDGPSFLAAWRAERGYRKVPVVLFTSAADGVTVAAALDAQACISKPFDLDVVSHTIACVLGAPVPEQHRVVYARDAVLSSASSARMPARIAALRERAYWTRQTIARSERTLLSAESCLGRVWTQSNS